MGMEKKQNKWLALTALALLPFMATVDGSATAIALPVIAQSLSINTEAAQLVQIVYLTVIAVTTMLFGRLGDIKGKGVLFLIGITLFTVGTFLAAVSQTFGMLIAARVIEAVGAAAAMANNQGIVTEIFPPAWRGRALGIVGMSVALGAVAGPLLGGFLVSAYDWHAIYMLNIPIGVVILLLGLKVLPRGEKRPSPVDGAGAALIALPVFLFFFVLLGGQRTGYNEPYVLILLAAAVALFLLFLFVEKRAAAPLLSLSMFKNPLLSISLICMGVQFFSVSSMGAIQPYFMEDVLQLDAGTTGLVMAGMSITMAVASPLSGWISDKRGPRLITLVGAALVAGALFSLTAQGTDTAVPMLILPMILLGMGSGFFNSPNNSLIMSTATKENAGVTGSMAAFTRSFSNTAGTSVFTVLFYTLMSNSLGYKVTDFSSDQPQAFVAAMHGVYAICACVMLICVALCVMRFFGRFGEKKDTGAAKSPDAAAALK